MEGQLRERVEKYWQAMEKRDKYAALEFVLPESRNAFIQRREFVFRNWQLEEIQAVQDGAKAQILVSVERLMEQSGTFYPTPIRQTWVYQDDHWYLSVPKVGSKGVHELLYGLNRKQSRVIEGEIRVLPDVVKMSFLNPVQRGAIVIQNGLEQPLRLISLKVDNQQIQVEGLPEQVAAKSEAKVYLRYLGDEEEKDLRSRARLVLEDEEGTQHEYSVQILYNHISETTKAFFGLTDEQARQLKRGEKLTPKFSTPPGAGQAPPGIPEEVLEPDSNDPAADQ